MRLVWTASQPGVRARQAAEARGELSERYRNVRFGHRYAAGVAGRVDCIRFPRRHCANTPVPGRRRGYAAGSSWFDALALEGRLVLVAGDVVGHGVGRLIVIDTYGVTHADLGRCITVVEALEAVDRHKRYLDRNRPPYCVGSLDFTSGEFPVPCTAGHPPPLLVTADALKSRYVNFNRRGSARRRNPDFQCAVKCSTSATQSLLH